MTTVIWTEGTLLSDTRCTFYDAKGNPTAVDNIQKIHTPKNMFCDGQKILALGIAGNAFATDIIANKGDQGLDLMNMSTYVDLPFQDKFSTQFIVITLAGNYTVSLSLEEGLVGRKYKKTIGLAIGSGSQYLESLFNKEHPYAMMGCAMKCDKETGGLLLTWTPGSDVLQHDINVDNAVALLHKFNWFATQRRIVASAWRMARNFSKARKALSIH